MPTRSADVTQATTPTADWYRNPEIYQAQLQSHFLSSWQLINLDNLPANTGDVMPFTLLPDSLNVPLLMTADGQQLHCLSNVCTHRGSIICQQAGRFSSLRCPYHSRRFELDGTFRHAPGFEGASDFPRQADNLPQLPLNSFGPLWFTRIIDGICWDNWLRPVYERLHWLPLTEFRFDASRSHDYQVNANWALYVENYLDSLHIPYVHKGLNDTLNFDQYSTELFDYGSLQLAIAADTDTAFALPPDSVDYGQRIAAYYFWLFPNLMLNFYPWGLSVNLVEPQGVQQTRVRFRSYVWKSELLHSGAGADLDQVECEDEAMIHRVQSGINSPLYHEGRYAPKHEAACHQFHQLAFNPAILKT